MASANKLVAKARIYAVENKVRITDGVAKAKRAAYGRAPSRYHSQIGNTARAVLKAVDKLATPPSGPTSR